jgi:hypothetical protein
MNEPILYRWPASPFRWPASLALSLPSEPVGLGTGQLRNGVCSGSLSAIASWCFFLSCPSIDELANWPQDMVWGICNALLGTCFIFCDVQALHGELRDRAAGRSTFVPVVTPLLLILSAAALVVAASLWLSVFDFIVARGQAIYVVGLVTLLAFGTLEFLFFIGLASKDTGKA